MDNVKSLFNSSVLSGNITLRRCREEGRILSGYSGEFNGIEPDTTDCVRDSEYQFPKIPRGAFVPILLSVIILAYFTSSIQENEADDDSKLVPPNPTKPLPPSGSTMHFFQRAAVCADGPICAKIGKDILLMNGSAVDSIIAAMFCNGIVNMQSMGIGGGFLMTIYIRKEKKVYSLNARETAPMKSRNRFYKGQVNKSESGPLAIGVPGELRGYWAAHQQFGKLSWNQLIEPSIKLCENGYSLRKHQYMALFKKDIANDYNFREWFRYKNGSFKKPGTIIIPKRFCETLRIIAKNGANDVYDGVLSKMLQKDIEEAGGIITAEDLKDYQVEWQEPVSFQYGGRILYSAPPPGSGILVGYILNILEGYGFTRENLMSTQDTVITYHRMIEAFKYAFAKRGELDDPNFVNLMKVLKILNSKEYARGIRLKIAKLPSSDPRYYGADFFAKENHGTAQLSVLAPNGDAVSVTSSLNLLFGAGMTSKQTGIVLNSVMNDFSFPNSINYYGLVGSPKNKMEPGKRPLSSMAPSIVVNKKGDVKMVVGAAGGSKIITTVAQVIMRIMWFGDNLKESVDAPKIHHQLFPMQVNYDYGILQQVIDGLRELGHTFERKLGTNVCALLKKGDYIIGNADYRKEGEVFGIT